MILNRIFSLYILRTKIKKKTNDLIHYGKRERKGQGQKR